jgi:hypothetical protein
MDRMGLPFVCLTSFIISFQRISDIHTFQVVNLNILDSDHYLYNASFSMGVLGGGAYWPCLKNWISKNKRWSQHCLIRNLESSKRSPGGFPQMLGSIFLQNKTRNMYVWFCIFTRTAKTKPHRRGLSTY